MTDLDNKEGPLALMRHLGELLTAQEVDYETDISGTMIAIVGEAEVARCDGIISVEPVETEEKMNLLQVGYTLPFEQISETSWPALFELLALLTPHLIIGHLEFDHETSLLHWRAHQLLSNAPPWNDHRILVLPVEGIDTVDRLHSTISKVIEEGDDPNVAVAEMLLAARDEAATDLFESEILRLLKTARRRLVTTDEAAIDRVSKLLMKLTE